VISSGRSRFIRCLPTEESYLVRCPSRACPPFGLTPTGRVTLDFEFSEEQKILSNTLGQWVEKEADPLLAGYPADQSLPKEACQKLMGKLQPFGALGARVPVQDGGSGLGAVGAGILAESLPYCVASLANSTEVAAVRICFQGSEELKNRFVPQLLTGDKIGTSATSEPNVGSDPRGVETKAIRSGREYIINGTKIWVTNGSVSDVIIVTAATGKDKRGRNELTRFVVEKEKSPFEAREISRLGTNQAHLSEVVFTDCHVPEQNMVGVPGDAHKVLSATWLSNRPILGLCAVRVAQNAIDAATAYAKERKQFDKVIASFQLIQSTLVEMTALVDASRLLCYRALSMVDKGRGSFKDSSIAKYFAAEAAIKVTSMAIGVHGAFGVSRESSVERLYRDARVIAFADGTPEIMKLIAGREITGIRAFV